MNIDKYNLYLKLQKPINFYDICVIHQPSFDQTLDYEGEFDKLLIPYSITIDMLDGLPNEEKDNISNFDLVCARQDIFEYLIVSLNYFCKSNLNIDERGFYFEGFKGRLNKDNFDEFAELILAICGRERPKIEKPPNFKNEKQKDIWYKIQEGRKRTASKNIMKMEDIINICEFGGNYYIPVEEIRKWTLWRIMNCYKARIGTSNYQDSFSIFLVSGDKSLIEDKHWTNLLKVNYQYNE